MVDDRRAGNAPQRTQAGEGDGGARQRIPRRLATARALGHAGNTGSAGPQVQAFGMAQHRHHEPALGLRGDTQVHPGVAGHHTRLVVVAGVDLRKLAQRQHHSARQEGQHRELAARRAIQAVELGAQGLQLSHVDLFDVAEMRNAALGFLHLLRNLAAQADDGDGLFAMAFGVACWALGGCLTAGGGVGIQVALQDAPGRAAAMHVAQLHAHIECTLAHGRRCEWALTRGTHHGGCAALHRARAQGRRCSFCPCHRLGRCGSRWLAFRY